MRSIVGPQSRYVLVAAGGIHDAESVYRKIRLGASLVQVYTALDLSGPALIPTLLRGMLELLDRDDYASIADVVGADVDL